jgi:hypothetical protein
VPTFSNSPQISNGKAGLHATLDRQGKHLLSLRSIFFPFNNLTLYVLCVFMDKLLLGINRDIFMHLALVMEIRCDLVGLLIVPVCNTSLRLTFQHVQELDNMVY